MSEELENEEVIEDPSPLGESDEDFLNMAEPSEVIEPEIEAQQEEVVAEVEEVDSAEIVEEEEETPNEAVAPTEPEPEATTKNETYSDEASSDDIVTEEEIESPTEDVANVDYEAEYNKIMGGFKANGREVKLSSVDDAVRLMQMGSDYHSKMAALKPSLKMMKMLDNNNLLNEAKLSYLIDLDKKNPEAITKLIKDSGIDPLDVDVAEETTYNPNNYTVSDKEVELDDTLNAIQDTPSYDKTIDIISNQWDESSKQVLLKEPSIIKVLNEHVASGVYDQINEVVSNERMMGRLQGLSHLEAYKQVGDSIQARGGFASQQNQPVATVASTQAPVIDTKIKDRKRAASSPKNAPSKKKMKKDLDPLSMSDEEFESIVESDFN